MNTPDRPGRTVAHQAVRSTVWVSLGSYASIGLGFAANLALTRLLPPEIFGLFSLSTFWGGLLNLRPKAGLNQAAVQQPQTDGQLLGTFWALDLGLSALTLTLTVGVISLLPSLLGYSRPVQLGILAFVGTDCLTALISPVSMMLEREMQLGRVMLISLLGYAAGYAVAIGLALAGVHAVSLFAVTLVFNVVGFVSLYRLSHRHYPQIYTWRWRASPELAAKMLRRGLPIGLSLTAVLVITSQFDNFLVGTFVGTQALGWYDRAFRIAHWTNVLLTTVISRVAFVTFARVQNDPARLTHAVRLAFWLLFVLGLPVTLVIAGRPSDLVTLLYGSRYAASTPFLQYLAMSALAAPFMEMSLALSTALGQGRITLGLTTVQALATIGLATPLTLHYGAMGTVIGVCLTALISVCLSCAYIFRQTSLTIDEVLRPPLLAAAGAALALLALGHWANWADWWPVARLALTGATAVSVYYGLYMAQRPTETLERLRYLRQVWRAGVPS